MASTIVGATKPEQLEISLRALELEIPAELATRLDHASRPKLVHPYDFFELEAREAMMGGTRVMAEQPWYRLAQRSSTCLAASAPGERSIELRAEICDRRAWPSACTCQVAS